MADAQYDIVIAGGGIAGLTAAAAFGQAGFDVLCVDPAAPVTAPGAAGADLRSTAFLQPARDFLAEIGLWPRLAEAAMPLQRMRIVDAGGAPGVARVVKEFDAADISDRPFGWNLPNWLLRREILAHLEGLPTVTFRPGVGAAALLAREAEARLRLSDGTGVRARLVIAADGRNSPMRRAAGIGVQVTRFGQKALAFAVTHPKPHENVSTEVHRAGGPFTLVPLPDRDGQPSSAIVWMEEARAARRLAELPEAEFEAEMTERSCNLFGPLKLASRRSLWPIIAQQAEALAGTRLALIAEAAHVLPPIGAQGLNMSLADTRALWEAARSAPAELGTRAMLDAYARARRGDIALRHAGITALNRASMAGARPLRDARALGLEAIYALPAVRRMLMQMGLGARG